MASGVMPSHTISVHQTLHGYADGHRLLASSTSLNSRDANVMLVLSDVSGPGARVREAGYLTGYPLPDMSMFAIGRTWAAPEMSRPGCVWTHTLLLDFADVAIVDTPGSLLQAFRRPRVGTGNHSFYESPIRLKLSREESPEEADSEVLQFLSRTVAALYERPQDRIVVPEPDDVEYERWIMAIWCQQWPRLRRNFRFCTQSFADRSSDGVAFDLQLVPPQNRSVWGRVGFVHAEGPGGGKDTRWLDDVLSDLVREGELRTFLRKVGGDVGGGRESFLPLVTLHGLLGRAVNDPRAVEDAIALVGRSFGADEGGTARSLAIAGALRQIESLSESAFEFVMRHLDALSALESEEDALRIGSAVWSRSPVALAALVDQGGTARRIAELTYDRLPSETLVKGLQRYPELTSNVGRRRPELLSEPEFWRVEGAASRAVFDAIGSDAEWVGRALRGMILTGDDRIARAASTYFDGENVLNAILGHLDGQVETEPSSIERVWLVAGLKDVNAAARVLSRGEVQRWATLVAIARSTEPDTVPNEYGEDPWLIGVRATAQPGSDRKGVYLDAYLLSRALGHRSRSQAELLSFSFDRVYAAAADSRLSEDAWELLDGRLPWSLFWWEWDHCRRLRAGLAGAFVARDLSPSIFSCVTEDEPLFREVALEASVQNEGRSYLRRVLRALRERADSGTRQRILSLESLVD